MSRIHMVLWIGFTILLAGCTEESGPTNPKPTDPPLYGALVTPRVSDEADPLLVDAYQALDVDGGQIGHLALSWAAVEQGATTRDWSRLDPHVEQARRRDMKLSVVVEFIHGGEGEAPAWRWPVFPDWDDPGLLAGLSSFLRELAFRADGTIAYLWLGEGPDRHAALYAGNDAQIEAFYAAIADSARAVFPTAAIGTMITPALLEQDGKEALVRTILESLDLIGLSLYVAKDGDSFPVPAAALEWMKQAIAPWQSGRFAVLEAGYPSGAAVGSSEETQAEFVTLVGSWLFDRPTTLELFCWSPGIDPSSELAPDLAIRRFPNDGDAQGAFAEELRSMALRRLDGSPKLGRQAWIEARP